MFDKTRQRFQTFANIFTVALCCLLYNLTVGKTLLSSSPSGWGVFKFKFVIVCPLILQHMYSLPPVVAGTWICGCTRRVCRGGVAHPQNKKVNLTKIEKKDGKKLTNSRN